MGIRASESIEVAVRVAIVAVVLGALVYALPAWPSWSPQFIATGIMTSLLAAGVIVRRSTLRGVLFAIGFGVGVVSLFLPG